MSEATHQWIREIKESDQIRGLYLAKSKKLATTKRGEPFLMLLLADRTGDIETRVWERANQLATLFNEGDILQVEGKADLYRNQVQLVLTDLKRAEDQIDPSLFMESSPRPTAEMVSVLKHILNRIENRHLKVLVDRFLSDRQFMEAFRQAPAAKNFHHAYLGGLLEHTLSVCEIACSVAEKYPELDCDMLLTGAFLHDIGKIREFKTGFNIEYTDEGRLVGHLVMGVTMVEEKVQTIKKFPQDLALRLTHLMLSHHGQFEFGSPKRPKFLEALVLNLIDDLDAKIKGIGRFLEKDPKEGSWTDYNRLFERYFLKGRIQEPDEAEAIPSGEERQEKLFKIS
jgi:3'-5' exoribonuclease